MRGGVVLVDPTMPHSIAFLNFIRNCPHVQILTDTSRSSLTLYFHGCPTHLSPYRHTRVSHGFRPITNDRRVTQCIVKLVVLHPTHQQIVTPRPFVMSNHASDRTDFLLETAASIDAEVNMQYRIHNQSLFPIEGAAGGVPAQSYFAPICPAIINYMTNVTMPNLISFRDGVLNRLQERVPVPRPGEDPDISARRHDRRILNDFFNFAQGFMPIGGGLGIITMEIMSNCTTLHTYLGQPAITAQQQEFMYNLTRIQMIRLGAMGIVHTDLHTQNIMVNTTIRYLSEPYPLGNVFLIDFGSVRIIQPTWDIAAILGNYSNVPVDAGVIRAMMEAMQHYNRAFLDYVRQQVYDDTPGATVEEFIENVRQMVIARLGNTAPQLVGGGDRISTKNKPISNKKMSLDEFVDMIITDMNPPVKFDLRETMKISPLNKSRRRQGTKISPSPTPKRSAKRSPSPTPKRSAKRSPSPTPKRSVKRSPSPTPKRSAKRSPTPKNQPQLT